DGKFVYYGKNYGLPNDFIYAITKDLRSNFWLLTPGGISSFNPLTKTFFNSNDPERPRDGVGNGLFTRKNGEILSAGRGQFWVFHPDSFMVDSILPPVLLTDFLLANTSVPIYNPYEEEQPDFTLSGNIETLDSITLRHDQNQISLQFSTTNSKNQDVQRFIYRLFPYQREWLPSPVNSRQATFTNLEPGKYTFEVKTTNLEGNWFGKPRQLFIEILPPWWRTWWAYLIYSIIIILILIVIVRTWLARQKLKQELAMEAFEKTQLKQLDILKSRFFANISHEFRTPLTLISGPLSQLMSQYENNPETYQNLSLIQRNSQRLKSLINQILDLNQLEVGKLEINLQSGYFMQYMKMLVSSFESLAVEKEIDYNVSIPSDISPVLFDQDKIEKIISNLLSNAFKFSDEGDLISVKINQENHSEKSIFTTITISDTGQGIPPSQLPHIFDRFFQADDSSTRKHEGSGIGLALTKELVELLNGSISVISEPNKGTAFIINLSFEKTDEEPQPFQMPIFQSLKPEYGIYQEIPNGELPLLLLVEDNNDMRSFLRESLKASYQILEASNGVEGLELAKANVPDLIISDVMMPRMDGMEFCGKVKTTEITGHIPVILLTAKAGVQSKVEGYTIGADAYLTKPFEEPELKALANSLIEQRKKLRETFSRSVTVEPSKMAITSVDEQFLEKVKEYLESNYQNSNLDVNSFADEMNLSRAQLGRKIKALTGKTPIKLIMFFRFGKAQDLLKNSGLTIAEIATKVGYDDPSLFSRNFKDNFQMTPSEFMKKHQ
ncbi:MAG: response regulator, partial [Bacteroidetes bacterium]|nr:response regulator [Bacteroidota bacterium]